MTVPLFLPKRSRKSIATYDYVDVAEGTGIVIFYGFSQKVQAAETYALSRSTTYSYNVLTQAATAETTFTKILEKDFDLAPFNLPKNLKGTARVIVNFGGTDEATDAGEAYVIAKLMKGAVVIASAQSPTLVIPTLTFINDLCNMLLTITGTHHFKIGEVLTLKIEVWAKKTSTSPTTAGFAHDPKNRASTSFVTTGETTTILELHAPFKLTNI